MQTKLARELVSLGVIRQGTVLEAYQSARGLSCVDDAYALTRYVVLGASATEDYVYFKVVSKPDEPARLRCDYVAAIDGMAVRRVAAAHRLQESGDPLQRVPRRRTPK